MQQATLNTQHPFNLRLATHYPSPHKTIISITQTHTDPIVQILTRFPETYIYFKYAFNNQEVNLDATYFNLQYLNNVLVPSSGTGYFFVFLALQPGAYRHFCSWFAFFFSKRDFAPDVTNDMSEQMGEEDEDEDEDEERASADLSFSSARDSQQHREQEQQQHQNQRQQQQKQRKKQLTRASISTLSHLRELDENDLGVLIERTYASSVENSSSNRSNRSSRSSKSSRGKRKSDSCRLEMSSEVEMRRSSNDDAAPPVPNPIVAAAAGDGWLTAP